MAERKLLGEFLVASPLIMLLGIAIEARTSKPAFEPYAYSDFQQRSVESHQPFAMKAIAASDSRDPKELRTAANAWLEAIKEGRALPMRKANYFDSSRFGVKGQIAQTIDQLACDLSRAGAREIEGGRVDLGLDDVELAIRVARILKGVDLESIGYFTMRERMCFEVLDDQLHQLNQSQLKRALAMLDSVNVSEQGIVQCAAMADRFYLIDGLRWNERRPRILDPLARNQLVSNSGRSAVNQFSITSLSRPLFEQANSMRYAISSVRIASKALDKVRGKIKARIESAAVKESR